MHELSIAMSIVEQVTEVVKQKNATSVTRIELDIGELSGLEWASFDFAWQPATRHSVLEHAERIVNRIPGIALCVECGHQYPKHQAYDACPACQSYFHQLMSGKELRIKSIMVK